MEQQKKGELIGGCVGLLCIYVLLGMMFYFGNNYDLLSKVRILVLGTFVLLIGIVPFAALVYLFLFIKNKTKR